MSHPHRQNDKHNQLAGPNGFSSTSQRPHHDLNGSSLGGPSLNGARHPGNGDLSTRPRQPLYGGRKSYSASDNTDSGCRHHPLNGEYRRPSTDHRGHDNSRKPSMDRPHQDDRQRPEGRGPEGPPTPQQPLDDSRRQEERRSEGSRRNSHRPTPRSSHSGSYTLERASTPQDQAPESVAEPRAYSTWVGVLRMDRADGYQNRVDQFEANEQKLLGLEIKRFKLDRQLAALEDQATRDSLNAQLTEENLQNVALL